MASAIKVVKLLLNVMQKKTHETCERQKTEFDFCNYERLCESCCPSQQLTWAREKITNLDTCLSVSLSVSLEQGPIL